MKANVVVVPRMPLVVVQMTVNVKAEVRVLVLEGNVRVALLCPNVPVRRVVRVLAVAVARSRHHEI